MASQTEIASKLGMALKRPPSKILLQKASLRSESVVNIRIEECSKQYLSHLGERLLLVV